jgi:hypothetical protein
MSPTGLPTIHRYWLSCQKMTIEVHVDGINRITWAAPIVRKFVKQPLSNLEKWMSKLGGFQKIKL